MLRGHADSETGADACAYRGGESCGAAVGTGCQRVADGAAVYLGAGGVFSCDQSWDGLCGGRGYGDAGRDYFASGVLRGICVAGVAESVAGGTAGGLCGVWG